MKNPMSQTSDSGRLSLLDLQQLVKKSVESHMPRPYWVVAEINELKENSSGHCYMELVQHDEKTSYLQAKLAATIWAYSYRMLKPFFELSTGKALSAGLKVLVKATVQYHEVYGFSLNIIDIDPSYTVGELELQRQKTIKQLKADGVFDINREVELPLLPQRIAIISSEKAAGYQDFMEQLMDNPYGYAFTTTLFSALVQGREAEASLLAAINRAFEQIDRFDVLVILRGGGSQADLMCFDSYHLAYHVAQLPIPVLTGIGHDKDESIVDMVAHTMLKTPTAVASYLIDVMLANEQELNRLASELVEVTEDYLNTEQARIRQLASGIGTAASYMFDRERMFLSLKLQSKLQAAVHDLCKSEAHKLALLQQSIDAHNPQHILKLGYALVERGKQRVVSTDGLEQGDLLKLRLADGTLEARVENIDNEKNSSNVDA